MKQILPILLLTLTTASAFASKARVNSLQGANHIFDVQTTFRNPAHISKLSPLITLEMGSPGTDAEGGLIKKMADGNNMLIYLGHQNNSAIAAKGDLRTDNGFLGQNNPIEVIWGTDAKALGFSFSNINNEKTGTKESTLVGKYGFVEAERELYAHFTVLSTAEKANGTGKDKMSAGPRITLGGALNRSYRYFGQLTVGKGESKPNGSGAIDITDNDLMIGAEDRSLKTATSDIYYGGQINFSQRDIDGTVIQTMFLPAFLGVEHQLNTWATFRGSISQNLLIGYTKDESVSDKNEGIPSNTTVTAGLGLAYNNLVLDGSLTAASNGDINGNQFLTQTSVTYNF